MKAALAAKIAEAEATKANNEFDDLQDLLVAIHALLPGTDGGRQTKGKHRPISRW